MYRLINSVNMRVFSLGVLNVSHRFATAPLYFIQSEIESIYDLARQRSTEWDQCWRIPIQLLKKAKLDSPLVTPHVITLLAECLVCIQRAVRRARTRLVSVRARWLHPTDNVGRFFVRKVTQELELNPQNQTPTLTDRTAKIRLASRSEDRRTTFFYYGNYSQFNIFHVGGCLYPHLTYGWG